MNGKQQEIALARLMNQPKLLQAFEQFTCRTWCQEDLLFIEAVQQLRHESHPDKVEVMLQRIMHTFIDSGAPLELNATTKVSTLEKMRSYRWSIITQADALKILADIEQEVTQSLNVQLHEFFNQYNDTETHPLAPHKWQKRVVIIGGGFTGITVASILDPMPLFHVTLIDTKDSFEFTPGIIKKIVNPQSSTSLRVRHDSYIRNGQVIIGYVEDIGPSATWAKVNGQEIQCDYLVIATGSSYGSQLKTTDLSTLYRLSGIEDIHEDLVRSRDILIIGGGLVGCELASEISQFTFPGDFPKKNVTLIDSHPQLIHRSVPEQREKAHKFLEQSGVHVISDERIVDMDTTDVCALHGSSGHTYTGFDKVFRATGTRPTSDLLRSCKSNPSLEACVDIWGAIRVRRTLQIDHPTYDHVFAGGDVTNVLEEKTGYAATISGVCIARNICRLVKGKSALQQGAKGTIAAPSEPLHGLGTKSGIGKEKLPLFKKKFAFLNPAWASLKFFDEQQFLQVLQRQAMGQASHRVLGKLPRKLNAPQSYLIEDEMDEQLGELSKLLRMTSSIMEENEKHFTFGGEPIELFHQYQTVPNQQKNIDSQVADSTDSITRKASGSCQSSSASTACDLYDTTHLKHSASSITLGRLGLNHQTTSF